MIQFTIPGNPTGKARPRVTKFGTFTPEKTVNFEVLVKEMFAINFPDFKPVEGQIDILIKAFFPMPQSASKKKREYMMMGMIRPAKKPDWDNVGKAITDALEGMAYRNDSQITDATVQKRYSENPRVEVTMKWEVQT